MERLKQLTECSKNITVLLVEDDTPSAYATLRILKNIFDSITVAHSAEEAIEIFHNSNIDLIIADITLPNLDGLSMAEELKKIDPAASIIILSAFANSDFLLRSIQIGVDSYIVKPLDSELFFDALCKAIEKELNKCTLKNNLAFLHQYKEIADKSTIISKTDLKGRITYANENFCKISGYTLEELIGKSHNIIRHPNNPKELYEEMWYTIKHKKKEWEGILKNITKNGTSYYVKTIIKPILDAHGEIIEYIGIRDNLDAIIDDKKHLLNKIDENILSILVLVQIEEFDMLEKFYHIAKVDQIEKIFAFNLLSYLPKEYTFENIYTLGDGKYALLTDYYGFDKLGISIANYLEDFIEKVHENSFMIDEIEYDLNITLSYATGKYMLYEDAKAGLEDAIKKNTQIKYANDSSSKVSREAKKNFEVIKMVKIALDNYKIVSYFQPIINNKTQQIEKYESLVRLIDEKGKVISPFEFLAISKQGNYYNKITDRVLENSFKMLAQIKTKLSINLSTIDIEKPQTRKKIFELLDEYSELNHNIIFELLEDESVKDFESIKNFIKQIKARGVMIAIDDFGAGYSNFERLLQFEPDILKIDGSLVKNIEHDLYSRNVVETIVAFAKRQNILTVAEFVENGAIFDILTTLGVDFSQGYYFGKPQEMTISPTN